MVEIDTDRIPEEKGRFRFDRELFFAKFVLTLETINPLKSDVFSDFFSEKEKCEFLEKLLELLLAHPQEASS